MSKIIDYLLDPERHGMIAVMVLALLVGIGAGFFLSKRQGPQSTKPDAPIEWNKVQALPKATSDVEDNEWQERSDELDGTVSASHHRKDAALDQSRPAAGDRAGGAAGNDDN